jgi:Na+-transporting NADH:ubiquinone oxidoreductase subunit NqrD
MFLLFGAGIFAMAVPPILSTIPLDMRLPPREVAVALGLIRTLFPMGATLGPLLVGAIQESTDSLFLGLAIVSPMAFTLFLGGKFLPETGTRHR